MAVFVSEKNQSDFIIYLKYYIFELVLSKGTVLKYLQQFFLKELMAK